MSNRQPVRNTGARIIVGLNFVACLAFGVASWLAPARVARVVEIALGSATALADFRAMYGGLCLAIAAFLLRGLRSPNWLGPSLYLTASMCAGLASGRIYSSIVDGVPSGVLLGALATEVISLVWSVIAYRQLRAHDQPADDTGQLAQLAPASR